MQESTNLHTAIACLPRGKPEVNDRGEWDVDLLLFREVWGHVRCHKGGEVFRLDTKEQSLSRLDEPLQTRVRLIRAFDLNLVRGF